MAGVFQIDLPPDFVRRINKSQTVLDTQHSEDHKQPRLGLRQLPPIAEVGNGLLLPKAVKVGVTQIRDIERKSTVLNTMVKEHTEGAQQDVAWLHGARSGKGVVPLDKLS